MPEILLPDNTASSLGKALQIICPESFSESHLNKILRILIDARNNYHLENTARKEYSTELTLQLSLFSSESKKEIQKFINKSQISATGKKKQLKVVLCFPEKQVLLTIDSVTEFIRDLVFLLKKGVTEINTGSLREDSVPASRTLSEAVLNLVKDVVHAVSPLVVITD